MEPHSLAPLWSATARRRDCRLQPTRAPRWRSWRLALAREKNDATSQLLHEIARQVQNHP